MVHIANPTILKKNTTTATKVFYVIAPLVIIAVLVALWQMGGGSNNSPGANYNSDSSSAKADRKQANSQLASLQKQFMQVQNKNRSATMLIMRVRSYCTAYPSKPDGWVLLSQVLMYEKKADQAYGAINSALKLKPKSATMQVLAGTLAMQAGKPDEAAGHYKKAIAQDKDNGKYYLFLASAQIKLKHYSQAQTTLQSALDIDSSLYKAHGELAEVYAKQGKFTRALKQVRRAIEMVPDDKKDEKLAFVQSRARILNRAGKPQTALSVLHDLDIKQRYKPSSLKIAGKAWQALGKPAQAANEYEQARVLYPVNKAILAWAIHYHIKAGNLEKARTDLSDLKNITSNAALIQMLQNDIDKAAKSQND